MMDNLIVLFLIVIFLSLIGGLMMLNFHLTSRIKDVESQIPKEESLQSLATRLSEADKAQRESFERLAGGLGKLTKATEQMMEVGKTITSLENLLKPPKLRGGMGETLLGELLSQILPPDFYEFQHHFRNGETVDAVIKISSNLVPVDAKFPLEDFRRLIESTSDDDKERYRKGFIKTLKNHVESISQKYILPDEGTLDFALMYIPAENIYYEAIIKDDMNESLFPYCIEKHVVPVSPNSFYAYLQVIIRGLKGMRIEEHAMEILNHLGRLKIDSERFREEFDVVGRHLNNARNKYDEADRLLARFEDKLISAGSPETDPAVLHGQIK